MTINCHIPEVDCRFAYGGMPENKVISPASAIIPDKILQETMKYVNNF